MQTNKEELAQPVAATSKMSLQFNRVFCLDLPNSFSAANPLSLIFWIVMLEFKF